MTMHENGNYRDKFLDDTRDWMANYTAILELLSNDALIHQRDLVLKEEIGMESFLRESQVITKIRKNMIKRWHGGESISPNPVLQRLLEKGIPPTVWVHPDGVLALECKPETIYAIDVQGLQLVYDLLTKSGVQLRNVLCTQGQGIDRRTFDMELPNRNKISVTVQEDMHGAIKTIREIKAPEISLCFRRNTGMTYRSELNILAFVSDALLPKKGMKLSIDSLTNKVALLWNGEVYKLKGEKMHRVVDEKEKKSLFFWEMNYPRSFKPYTSKGFLFNKPDILDWSEVQKPFIDKIQKLRQEVQINVTVTGLEDELEEEYPSDFGPLIAYVPLLELIRLGLLKQDPQLGYPEERTGLYPQRKYDMGNNKDGNDERISTIAKFGYVKEDDDMDNIDFFGWECRRRSALPCNPDGMVIIDPLRANDIYVFDGGLGRPDIVKSIRPITRYQPGQYKSPLILIKRELKPEEIIKIVFPPESGEEFYWE